MKTILEPAAVKASPTTVPKIVEAAGFYRIYFDASVWNLLDRHPDLEDLKRALRRRSRAVIPSLINAVELLRNPETSKLHRFCSHAAETMNAGLPILPHPWDILQAACKGWREGRRDMVVGETADDSRLRELVSDPRKLTEADLNTVDDWAAAWKTDLETFRNAIPADDRLPGARISEDHLKDRTFAEAVVGLNLVTRLGLSAEDVLSLFRETAVWAAFGGQVAYSIELALNTYGKKRDRKLAGGPDLMQLPYLGCVNEFVTRDRGLYEAASRVAAIVPGTPTVTWADRFFSRISYPLPSSLEIAAPAAACSA